MCLIGFSPLLRNRRRETLLRVERLARLQRFVSGRERELSG